MCNPETEATLNTQDKQNIEHTRQTKQGTKSRKQKKISNVDTTKKNGCKPGVHEGDSVSHKTPIALVMVKPCIGCNSLLMIAERRNYSKVK